MKEVLTNGAVRYFSDSYYSNHTAVMRSVEIREKRFPENK